MWQAAPLMMAELATYSPSSGKNHQCLVGGERLEEVARLTDENSPNIDEREEDYVGKFVKREEEGKDVVRHALGVTV